MTVTNVIALLLGITLFLFGMNLMVTGLKNVAGKKLEVILYKLTSNPVKGVLLGTGVTAVIQSSSATSVMVVGFVNSGMMKIKQAIGIIMGAIIGTSITGWIICLSSVDQGGIFEIFSTDTLTAVLAVIGIILLMFTKKEKNHHIAYILLGFAVLMVGISTMTAAVYPLRESEEFINLLTGFSNPLIGILIGMAFTCIIQSASAAVGILQTLAVTGAISFQLALPVIMGIAIGASVPVLLSALGANADGKRTALIYLLVDTLGVVLVGAVFYSANALVQFDFMSNTLNMAQIALLNTVFRIIIVLLLMPFIGFLEKLVYLIIPKKEEGVEELRDVERLEERFLPHPALAIEQTRIVINSMASYAFKSIREALKLFEKFSEEKYQKVRSLEETIDIYEDKLGVYIMEVMKNILDDEQKNIVSLYLHSINDFERLGDHAKNLAETAKEINEKEIVFSETARQETAKLFSVVCEILEETKNAFQQDNIESVYRVAPLEEIIDNLCDEFKANHIQRVQGGTCQYQNGYVFNDMLTDVERIGDHCSNLGIAIRIRHDEVHGRHDSLTKKEISKKHDFDKYYQEYLEKFSLQ